jgi:hypothetical protein
MERLETIVDELEPQTVLIKPLDFDKVVKAHSVLAG